MNSLAAIPTETLKRVLALREQRDEIDRQLQALASAGDAPPANGQAERRTRQLESLAKARAARWGKKPPVSPQDQERPPAGRKRMSAEARARIAEARRQWWAQKKGTTA